jgi:hypothetical protein
MWLYDLLLGLAMLPIGLTLAGAGGAGLWFLVTKAHSKMHFLVMLVSPLQAAAGIFLVFKSYDYVLSIFGIHLASWL